MSDDEQGYAPASYLEAMEESSREDTHPEGDTNEGRRRERGGGEGEGEDVYNYDLRVDFTAASPACT